MSILLFIAAAVILLAAFYLVKFYFINLHAHNSLKHIPGVSQLLPPYIHIPWIKKHLEFKENFFESSYNVIRTFGADGIVRTVHSDKPMISVYNVDTIKHVMVKYAKNYPKPESKMYDSFDIFGPNVLTTNGDDWRKHRVLSNPAFNEDHIKLLSKITNDTMTTVVDKYWNQESFVCDVVEDMTKITLQIMGLAGFGMDMDAIFGGKSYDASRYSMTFREAISRSSDEVVTARMRYPKWLLQSPLPYFKNLRQVVQDTDSYLSDLIATRSEDVEERGHDLLSLLISARDEENKMGLSPLEIKSDSFIFLFAGHETTASQLMWTLFLLATNQHVQDKLRKEADEIFNGRTTLEHDDYEKLKYTGCVIRESMRLHPPVEAVFKESIKEDVIAGHKIPPKTMVRVNFYAVQRDPKYWDKPEEFIPDRFNEDNIDKIPAMSYLPFSVGTRKCIGFMFSLTESTFILAHIVRNFSIDLTPDQKNNNFKPLGRQFITIKPDELSLQFTRISH